MDVKEKVERFKIKAKIFLDKNIKAFIEDIGNDYFFCEIVSVQEDCIEVVGFAGRRKFERDRIFFVDILRLEEYEEKDGGSE